MQFSAAHVSNLHFLRRRAASPLLHIHHRAVQPNAHTLIRAIQPAVIGFRGHHILHRAARHGLRNQRAHQQPRYGRIAIRKMKNVRLFFPVRRQAQPIESRIRERAVVIARLITRERRHCLHAHAEKIVAECLEKRQRLRHQFAVLRQIIGVADLHQLGELLLA